MLGIWDVLLEILLKQNAFYPSYPSTSYNSPLCPQCGGVGVVSSVLCSGAYSEEERSEAAGVLAQVTSPWVDASCHRLPTLDMPRVVEALTRLAEDTRSSEIFLLASAALANLTFLDGGCASAMKAANTPAVLIAAARDNPNINIFTRDQVITLVLIKLLTSVVSGL